MSVELIKKETIESIVKGGEQVANAMMHAGSKLTTEALNFFIFTSLLNVLKYGAIFLVFWILKKYLDTIINSADSTKEQDQKEIKNSKLAKAVLLCLSILYFTYNSYPHLVEIGKAVVAPNVFLMEKANSLINPSK
jgi:hypothetical protein